MTLFEPIIREALSCCTRLRGIVLILKIGVFSGVILAHCLLKVDGKQDGLYPASMRDGN